MSTLDTVRYLVFDERVVEDGRDDCVFQHRHDITCFGGLNHLFFANFCDRVMFADAHTVDQTVGKQTNDSDDAVCVCVISACRTMMTPLWPD